MGKRLSVLARARNKKEAYKQEVETVVSTVVANYFRVTKELLKSNARTRDVVLARQVYYYLMWWAGFSKKATGESIGRGHSAVIHGLKNIERLNRGKGMLVPHIKILKELIYDELMKRGIAELKLKDAEASISYGARR